VGTLYPNRQPGKCTSYWMSASCFKSRFFSPVNQCRSERAGTISLVRFRSSSFRENSEEQSESILVGKRQAVIEKVTVPTLRLRC